MVRRSVHGHTGPVSHAFLSNSAVALFASCIAVVWGHPAVDGGQRAVIWDRFNGIKPKVIGEGTHFRIPLIEVRVCSTPLVVAVAARLFSLSQSR